MRYLGMALLCILLITGCEKSELSNGNIEEEKSLQPNSTGIDELTYSWEGIEKFLSDKYLSRTNSKILDYNSRSGDHPIIIELKDHFINHTGQASRIANSIGMPVWDFSRVHEMEDHTLVIIPLAKEDSEKTEGLMFALYNTASGSWSFAYEKRNQFNHLSKAKQDKGKPNKIVDFEFVVSQFLICDKDVFDYFDCDLIAQFESYNDNLTRDQGTSRTYCYFNYEVTGYTDYYTCTGPTYDPYQNCWLAYSVPTYDYVPYCTSDDTYSPATDPTPPDNNPPASEPNPYEDENIIAVDLSPCAQAIVNKIKSNDFGGDLFVKLLQDIFDRTSDVNITITEDNLSSSLDGTMDISKISGEPDVGFYFEGTLTINSDFTGSGTKDWILATVIHEMIHG